MGNYRSRVPKYNDDTDYTTNGPSYYDALARFTDMLLKLTERMNDVEKRFKDLVLGWLEDGTLAGLLEQVLLDDYADREEVQSLIQDLEKYLDVELNNVNEKMEKIYGINNKRQYLYVDVSNGDDTTATGSQEKPYKTIQSCLDDIPKVINQDRFIMIAQGYYNEDIRIKSVSGSAIYLQSITGMYQLKSAEFFDINGLVRVENADFIGDGSTEKPFNLRFSRCNYATTNSCKFEKDKIGKEIVAIEYDGTIGSVNSCYFNSQYTCIFSQNGSDVRVDNTNTHGNYHSTRGVSVYSGHASFNGDLEWLNKTENPVTERRGGRVTWDKSYIDLELLNGWESDNDSVYKPRAFRDDSNVVHLMGNIKNGQIGNINALILPKGYRPVFNNYVLPAYVDDGSIAKIVIDRTGQLQIQSGNNTPYISLNGITFYVGR